MKDFIGFLVILLFTVLNAKSIISFPSILGNANAEREVIVFALQFKEIKKRIA